MGTRSRYPDEPVSPYGPATDDDDLPWWPAILILFLAIVLIAILAVVFTR